MSPSVLRASAALVHAAYREAAAESAAAWTASPCTLDIAGLERAVGLVETEYLAVAAACMRHGFPDSAVLIARIVQQFKRECFGEEPPTPDLLTGMLQYQAEIDRLAKIAAGFPPALPA